MSVYINGIGTISAQGELSAHDLLLNPVSYPGEKLTCVEPDYSQYVDIRQLRRMSRIIKMGMACGLSALREADVKVPDAIITGTSYGCLEDTGLFLTKMIDNKESALNPTPFIQSTHNTIGSQIALLLQCQGYNQTYTQRAFSFEHSLLDAMMSIGDKPNQSILTGAADEITQSSHDILRRFGIFRRSSTNNLNLFRDKQDGTLNGEGASYFVLSGHKGRHAVELKSVQSLYKPGLEKIKELIWHVLSADNLRPDDIDVVVVGKSGDARYDLDIDTILTGIFTQSTITVFKHLTGEFPTASALATSISCRMIQSQNVPEVIIEKDARRVPNRILIYNPYFGTNHSLILLHAC